MTRLITPLRLRAHAGESARTVTWLELFFDLVFVAAVAQVAEPLREHYSLAEVARFGILFALVWWAWTGYAVFATRFDADDAVQRLLTLVQMFVVAVMAANADDELQSRSSAGFAAAYAVLRFVLVAQYFRARHVPEARPLTTRYIAGHGMAAIIWLVSALVRRRRGTGCGPSRLSLTSAPPGWHCPTPCACRPTRRTSRSDSVCSR